MENETKTWPELAIGLYDKLTGRNAKITYDFQDLNVHIPSSTGSKDVAEWKLNGRLTISTTEK